jgi:hypothetical protein
MFLAADFLGEYRTRRNCPHRGNVFFWQKYHIEHHHNVSTDLPEYTATLEMPPL